MTDCTAPRHDEPEQATPSAYLCRGCQGALRGDFLFERGQVIGLRGLVTDIIDYLERMNLLPHADNDLIPEWRERAGLDAPAVVTAGTEHPTEQIRDLAIRDQEG